MALFCTAPLCENVSGKTLLESSVRSSYGGIVKIISTWNFYSSNICYFSYWIIKPAIKPPYIVGATLSGCPQFQSLVVTIRI